MVVIFWIFTIKSFSGEVHHILYVYFLCFLFEIYFELHYNCDEMLPAGALGTGLGWLHSVSVAFYCWIYNAKKSDVDIIIHECVPNFDPKVLEQCLQPDYIVKSFVWSALDEGLPIRRERRYTFCMKKSLAPASLNFQEHVWQQLVFCNRVASADIFSKLLELTLTFHFSYQHPYFVVTAFHMSWLACERGALA